MLRREQAAAVTPKIWKWPLANQILFGLVVGALAGLIVERTVTDPESLRTLEWWLSNVIQPIGRLFIRIIFMIVIQIDAHLIIFSPVGDEKDSTPILIL